MVGIVSAVRALGLSLLAAAVAAPARGEAPRLDLPLNCRPGMDCWVVLYPDSDPGPEKKDYMCGARTNDGQSATVFVLRNAAALRERVAVVAAAGGVVAAVRDEMPDGQRPAETDRRRDCGNTVVLDHADGWRTVYCHLHLGSVAVSAGERVEAGQRLGRVGMSGRATLAGLGFSVRHRNEPVDPFVGEHRTAACGLGDAHLWQPHAIGMLRYSPADLIDAGFYESEQPVMDTGELGKGVTAGTLTTASIPAGPRFVVTWIRGAGLVAGDRVQVRLESPQGKPLVHDTELLSKDQALFTRFFGINQPNWAPGAYAATVTLDRDAGPGGPVHRRLDRVLTVLPPP